jgi:hypothetical protein
MHSRMSWHTDQLRGGRLFLSTGTGVPGMYEE